jgi:hypothetical protein
MPRSRQPVPVPPGLNALLRITAHNTPYHTDPVSAGSFYAALGKLSVAWGRLEGHVIGNLLTIMNLLGATAEARLPFRWDERLELWKKGFSSVPSLQPHKERAVEFLKSIHESAEDRNYAAHAVWGEFVSNANEPTMMARGIKSGQRGIVVDDRRITMTMIECALDECNRLNLEMSEFTKLLQLLRPPPTGALSL